MKELKRFIKRLETMVAEAEEYARTHPFADDRKDAQTTAETLRVALVAARQYAGEGAVE